MCADLRKNFHLPTAVQLWGGHELLRILVPSVVVLFGIVNHTHV